MTLNHSFVALALAFGLAGTARAQQTPQVPPPATAPKPAAAPLPAGAPLPAAAQQPSTPPRGMTLGEALQLARRYNPSQVQAEQNIRVANLGVMQAWGAYLPSLNGTGSASHNSVEGLSSTSSVQSSPQTDLSSFGFSASLPLFTGFQRGANLRAANATMVLNQASLLQQDYATDLATKQAFFAEQENEELVGVAVANLAQNDQQLRLTTEKLRLGATTRSDSLTASVAYGTAEVQLIQARANVLTAQANLARAIGAEGMVAAVPDSTLEIRLASLDTAALRRDAESTAPSVVQAQAAVTAAQAQLAASRSKYYPTLTLSGSQTWSGYQLPWNAAPLNQVITGVDTAYIRNTRYTGTWNVQLALSIPLFNGFQTQASIVTADANAIEARAKLRDARLELDASLIQGLTALDAAAAQIDVSRTSVASAQESLRMQQERYRLGASTIVDLLTAETALNQAETGLVQSRYNYLIARATLEALVGHTL